MHVYIILYQGRVSSLGFKTEEEAFEWLEKERCARHICGYVFEGGYEIREVKINN